MYRKTKSQIHCIFLELFTLQRFEVNKSTLKRFLAYSIIVLVLVLIKSYKCKLCDLDSFPVINGEKAAVNNPLFAQKRERTLEMLIKNIHQGYMLETNKVADYLRKLIVLINNFPQNPQDALLYMYTCTNVREHAYKKMNGKSISWER